MVFMNGRFILAHNAPSLRVWNAAALESNEAGQWETFDLSEARSLLQQGDNLLAIHALNASLDSSDFLLMPELRALSLPSLARIERPKAAALSVSPGTGIFFQASTAEANPPAGASLASPLHFQWSVVDAD